jgi:hypothetical protein
MTLYEVAREDRAKPSMWMVRLLSLGATLILSMAGTGAAGQTPAPVQRVLVLYSDERLLPANVIMDEAIRAAFTGGTKNRVEFYSEFLDVARFPGEEQQQRPRVIFLGTNIGIVRPTWCSRSVEALSSSWRNTGPSCSPECRSFIVPSLVIRSRITFQTSGSRKSRSPIALPPHWR